MIAVPGRTIPSGANLSSATATKRSASSLQSSASESLGSAVKLVSGHTRDKERKEKEDVELKPPWDLLPYSRDISGGTNLATQKIPFLIPGYPDFYPSKGSEEEYKLTEKAITDGFENKPLVSVLLTSPPFRRF